MRSPRGCQNACATHADDGATVSARAGMPDHGPLLRAGDPRAGSTVVVGPITGVPSHALRTAVPGRTQRLPTRWTRSTCCATVGAVTRAVVQQDLARQQGVCCATRSQSAAPAPTASDA